MISSIPVPSTTTSYSGAISSIVADPEKGKNEGRDRECDRIRGHGFTTQFKRDDHSKMHSKMQLKPRGVSYLDKMEYPYSG